ncbi:unnamed protein product, partial [Angiostrongylus costaricensis]|uniref:Peptidase_M13_N domain-containing protein n=1 Tax=Angiostrongylus costaricensis TaxID=334426 RepID=A0A0R3Q2K0_ANGCS
VDPCVDFFEFTCGNWKARHPIPSYRSSYSQFSVLHDKVQAKMRGEIFESEEVFPSKSVTALKLMYRRCMDQHELNRIGARKLIESIRFDQGELGLGASTREYYLDREKYGKKSLPTDSTSSTTLVKLFHEDVGLPVNGSKIANDVDEIIDLETKMAQILVAEKDRRNYTKMYNLRHLSELQTLMPLVDWYRYFRTVAPAFINDYLAGNPKMLIIEIDYMRRVNRLISSTDPRIITNYAYLRYTLSWSGELGMRYEVIYQKFYYVMYGQKKKAPRWVDCTSTTTYQMQYAAGALYVRKAFNETSKNMMLEMIADLQDAFDNMLAESDWMDETTKARAVYKAKHMLRHVGYPDFILDDEKLDDYYSGVSSTE